MSERIVVINPNSSVDVTAGIDKAMAPLRFADGPAIECLTLAEGPPGIETQRHVDGVVGPLCQMIEREDNSAAGADAFVVACFSDPGLHSARETTSRPVMGISESGITTALTLGERFGIIAILPAGVARHKRYIRQMGLEGRLAGDRPIGIGVTGLGAEDEVEGRMTAVGQQLIEEDGADVLIMGCAGMARYRGRLEDTLGVPVIDPSQAAVAQAIAAVRLGYRNNKTNI
ncbi:MAG: Asp/Glu racemase [Rhodospirillaceae bacterium]|jgi:Asp/Glu/hydantoin racemase|nr:Asp/Glu racemase [Rhodospirillaceae bacterium]MBT3495542.1 Asp/Glu racemase [Rhodospirillaceae bacterium]MBT3782857.1 Asp/Glu racemase [Rhodospirillaceae bacterium]MBT3977914.1 Asp/Glu racemase [Rhodospirillaceae bacterium]MBT4561427.1 Asp/Glu racemase [Rhodospirillaceae bacterium]